VLSLSKHCPASPIQGEKAALRQAQGERRWLRLEVSCEPPGASRTAARRNRASLWLRTADRFQAGITDGVQLTFAEHEAADRLCKLGSHVEDEIHVGFLAALDILFGLDVTNDGLKLLRRISADLQGIETLITVWIVNHAPDLFAGLIAARLGIRDVLVDPARHGRPKEG